MSYRSYLTRFAEFPAVSLLFRGWVAGWVGLVAAAMWWVVGEVGTKTNLSPARASLLGLSLAI